MDLYRKNVSELPLYKEVLVEKEVVVDEPRGILRKKIVREDEKLKFVKFSDQDCPDQDLIEYLMYLLHSRIEVPSMVVELGYEKADGNTNNCCLVTDVVNKNLGNEAVVLESIFLSKEELLSYSMTMEQSISIMFGIFTELGIKDEEYESISQSYVNMLLCDFLFDNPDRHLENFFLIYNSLAHSYKFAPLIDNGEAFSSYKDGFSKCHLGYCQYNQDLYIEFLMERYYYQLMPLIERINSNLNQEYIVTVLNLPCFDNMNVNKKSYIINKIQENIKKINELATKNLEPDKAR